MTYTLRFDGLFRGLPGVSNAMAGAGFMCYGWLILRDGIPVAKGMGVFARGVGATSSVAEYLGLIEGLEALRDLGVRNEPVKVLGDAKSIIEQLQGQSLVSSPQMKPLYKRALKLSKNFPSLIWSWTPRRNNRAADLLSRRAIRQIRLDPGQYRAALQAISPDSPLRQRSRLLPVADLRIYQPVGLSL